MGTEENWNLPLSISPVFIIWVDSLFTLAFSLLVPDQAVHRIYLNWNYVCIYAKQGVLYKFELWLLFTNQILLTHTHTHTHTPVISQKTNRRSGNTWFALPHNSNSHVKTGFFHPLYSSALQYCPFHWSLVSLLHLLPDLCMDLGLWHLFHEQFSAWLVRI